MPRRRAAVALGLCFLVTTHFCILLRGSLDVMDFWAGTFGPQFFALLEMVLLMWLFGASRTWDEMHRGADLRAPPFFYYTTKWVTPLFLSAILGSWVWTNLLHPKPGRGLEGAGTGAGVWLTRAFLVALLVVLCVMVRAAWQRRVEAGTTGEDVA
jgi:hypothetical protein